MHQTADRARNKRPVRVIRVNLSRTNSRHEGVPIMVGAMRVRIELDHPPRVCYVSVIEQQEIHPARLP